MSSFRRRVGASADVKELEYIAALHQTCMPLLRENGTVSSVDICRFLKSRTSLNVPHEHGIRIVRGLGGGVVGDDVIQKILQDMKETEEKLGQNGKKRRWKMIGALAKREWSEKEERVERIVHEQDYVSFEPPQEKEEKTEKTLVVDDEAAVDVDLENANDGIIGDTQGEEYLDLVQLMAILLMPTLARAGKDWHDACIPEVFLEEVEPNYKGFRGWCRKMDDKRMAKLKEREDDESLRPKPETILQDVLGSMLKSVNAESGDKYPVMNAQLVRTLLCAHGEYERMADSVLVDKMVEAASSTTGLFDEEAFVTALTCDLAGWKVGSEDTQTTAFVDVWGFDSVKEESKDLDGKKNSNTGNEAKNHSEDVRKHDADGDTSRIEHSDNNLNDDVGKGYSVEESNGVNDGAQSADDGKDAYEIDRRQSWFDIDFSIDTHSSLALTVAIFFFFISTSLVYASLFQQIPELQPQCGDDFGCLLVSKIVVWMIFAVFLALTGYFVIIPLSIRNNPAMRSPLRNLFSLIWSLILNWMPFAAVKVYMEGIELPYDGPASTVKDDDYSGAQWLTRILGLIVSLLILIQFIMAVIGTRRIRASNLMRYLFGTSDERRTARIKKAATRKINMVLQNAHNLRPMSTSAHNGPALTEEMMLNFVLRGERREDYCGGIFWTWRRLLSGAVLDEEGIWIASRLIIIQGAQLILIAFETFAGFLLVASLAEQAGQARESLRPGYPDWVYNIVPTPGQVKIALYPALGVAMLVTIAIFLVYIPSYVGRAIQYRCGALPSLKSSDFIKYRVAADGVYTNIGNAIFAMIGAAFLYFFIVGLVIFLFIWPFSRGSMVLLVAWALGLMITIVLKQMLLKFFRKRHYAGFYRTNPIGANLNVLALECWFIGLGGGVLVARFISFILAACFFIGRTDVCFLSKEVALGGYAFEYVPTNFVKDLLVHEAHRHPYFERLLAMYMMKLKSDKFCSDAGACWRQLFVVTLMPWFMKHRVFSDERLGGYLEVYNARRLERHVLLSRSFRATEYDDDTLTTIDETDESEGWA